MREWDEITRDILIKRDEKIARKKAKMRVVKRTALSAFCFCLVSTAGIGIWKNIPQRSKPVDDSSIQQMITDENVTVIEDEQQVTTVSDESRVAVTQKNTTSVQTSAVKTTAATSASVRHTSLPSTTVTQSRAVNSRIAETVSQTEKSGQIVTTNVSVPINENETINERNVVMKKFFAALAAASTMVNPITANASPIARFDNKDDLAYNENLFSMYESGSEKTDLNDDGVFDVKDLYHSYVADGNRTSTLITYYLYKNGYDPEDFKIEQFFGEDNRMEDEGWWFYLDFGSWTLPSFKYNEIVRYDKEHDVDLDFNADGSADVKDILDYWLFTKYMSYGSFLMDEDYKNELEEKYNVEPYSPIWGKIHRLYSMIGRELPDLGFAIPTDKYTYQIPLDETTLKNCVQHLVDHWYITENWDLGEVMLTKEFVNCCGFTEEWLDPEFCEEYLCSRVDESVRETEKFKEAVEEISGKNGYEYSYMGEARVDAIEAGFVNYDDYKDVLSWHVKNENYTETAYPDYENAVKDGSTAIPDMNNDGVLDDKDMEILSVCYYATSTPNSNIDHVVDVANSNVAFEGNARSHFESIIRELDCNENGDICDDYDLLYAGIYIAKNGNVNFDLYSEFFASDLYTKYEDRTWRYYDRDPQNVYANMSYGYYYSYIISLADLLFDMDKANNSAPDPSAYSAPERSGDATLDGETNIGDAVLIMQTISNPLKYQLTSRGEFNADVTNTNDGITVKDALGIQRKLLGL